MDKITVFYKKKTLKIDAILSGEESYGFYCTLDEDEAELIYGRLIVDWNDMLMDNMGMFEVYQKDDGNYDIRMKDKYKKQLAQLLKTE